MHRADGTRAVAEIRAQGQDRARHARAAADRHGDVGERHAEVGVRLVDSNLGRLHRRVGEADVRQALGQGLEQVDRLAGEHGMQALGQFAVVDRLVQVVAGRGGRCRAPGPRRPGSAGPRSARRRRRRGTRGASARSARCGQRTDAPLRRGPPDGLDGATASTDPRGLVHPRPPGTCRGGEHAWWPGSPRPLLGGAGPPSAPASSLPRKLLREAPTSTGRPRPAIWRGRPAAPSCARPLGESRPGSSTISSGATPTATTASTRAGAPRTPRVTTSP